MSVAVLYSLVYHCASDLQRARVEGSNASCQFWNFTADGKQDAQRLHHLVCTIAQCLLYNQWPQHSYLYITFNAEGFGAWDSSSCRVLAEIDTEVTCGCDHLTHFAILLVSDGPFTGSPATDALNATSCAHTLCTVQDNIPQQLADQAFTLVPLSPVSPL